MTNRPCGFKDSVARLQAAFERHAALAGVAIWALGGEDPENWSALDQAFSNK